MKRKLPSDVSSSEEEED